MANKKTVSVARWYSVSYKTAKMLKDLKELIHDEPDAILEPTMNRNHAYVKTALTWDFLRESMTDAIVGIADVKNTEDARANV